MRKFGPGLLQRPDFSISSCDDFFVCSLTSSLPDFVVLQRCLTSSIKGNSRAKRSLSDTYETKRFPFAPQSNAQKTMLRGSQVYKC